MDRLADASWRTRKPKLANRYESLVTNLKTHFNTCVFFPLILYYNLAIIYFILFLPTIFIRCFWKYISHFFTTSCAISHATSTPFTWSKTHTCSFCHMKEHILFHYKIHLQVFIVVPMKHTDLILKNPAAMEKNFNRLILIIIRILTLREGLSCSLVFITHTIRLK